MKNLLLSVALLANTTAFAAFTGVTNYWFGSGWASYGEATNWKVGSKTSEVNAVPRANDMIYLESSTTYKFNLGGQPYTVAGIGNQAGATGLRSGDGTINITNGTLTVSSFVGKGMKLNVWDGGTFTLNATHHFNHSTGGTLEQNVKSGGTYNLNNLTYQGYYLTIDEDATVNLSGDIKTHPTSSASSQFDVYGTLNIPSGFRFQNAWSTTPTVVDGSALFTLFSSGDMTIGGAVKKETTNIPLDFLLKGGTLKSTGDVSFQNLRSFAVEENAEVVFNVQEGASLYASNATYGAGSVITKTGAGNFMLGCNPVVSLLHNAGTVTVADIGVLPLSHTMSAGTTLSIARKDFAFPAGYAFTPDTTLDIAAYGVRVDSPGSYLGLDVTVSGIALVPGLAVLKSNDPDFLEYAASHIRTSVGSDYAVVVDGDSIQLFTHTANTFDTTVSSDLNDTAGWVGGSVPAGGDVLITGGGTANLTASSPAFKTIRVESATTVSVSGGTLEAPVDIPPTTLAYSGRLLIAEGAFAQSTNGLNCLARSYSLPVLEVSTNATLILTTPGLPKAVTEFYSDSYYDYGFRLSNVNLKWYGQIRIPSRRIRGEQDAGTSRYWLAQAVIGWADKGEVSYIGLDCQGGTYYRYDDENYNTVNFSSLKIVRPTSGGTVIPVGTLLLRDYHREGEGEFSTSGTIIGANNPPSVRVPVVFDGNTDIQCHGVNRIAGGVDLTIRGPARWHHVHTYYNDDSGTRTFEICDSAKMTLEDGGYVAMTPTYPYEGNYNFGVYGFRNLATDDSAPSLVAKDSYIGYWSWVGSGITSARIEDSYLMVGQRYRADSAHGGDSLSLQTPLFNDFKFVEVPEDKTMWVVATNIWPGEYWGGFEHNWNRVAKFGPPIVGGGNIAVSNALLGTTQSKYSMTAIVTNGANTATGRAFAEAPSPSGAKSYLLFGDGANWAGTVVANGRVWLTNLVAEAAAPATVTFGNIQFETNFPVRLWNDNGVLTNDVVNVTGGISGSWGFEPVMMDGYTPERGDIFVLGSYPADAALPKLGGSRKWSLDRVTTEDGTKLRLRYMMRGGMLIFR